MNENDKLPGKLFEEFEPFIKNAKLGRRKGFWFTCLSFSGLTAIFTFVAILSFYVVNPYWYSIVLFAVILFSGIHVVGLDMDWKEMQLDLYEQYLSAFSYDLLKSVTESPEYNKQTKDAVVNYLSSAHPGWSLPSGSPLNND